MPGGCRIGERSSVGSETVGAVTNPQGLGRKSKNDSSTVEILPQKKEKGLGSSQVARVGSRGHWTRRTVEWKQ